MSPPVNVDLGFSEKCQPWQVQSYQFPSKIGGKPAWLSLENLPKPEQLQCTSCGQPMAFMCQVYAPYEENDDNFHRTLFLFICRNGECNHRNTSKNMKVFRNALPRQNKFYLCDPPDDKEDLSFDLSKWTTLCSLCGCLGEKLCSKCKKVTYCSRAHQIADWKEGHKSECCEQSSLLRISPKLYPEYELVIEPEDVSKNSVDEAKELEKLNELQIKGQAGTMQDVALSELETFAAGTHDKVFGKFKKAIRGNEDQILRYARGGDPLWIAAHPKPEEIPNCEMCGGERQFEFQIMPHLLSVLKEEALDWGIILVFSCKKSCTEAHEYKEEFLYKQDVSLDDI